MMKTTTRRIKSRNYIKLLVVLALLTLFGAAIYTVARDNNTTNTALQDNDSATAEQEITEQTDTEQPTTKNKKKQTTDPAFSLTDPSSTWIVVNKNRPIPATYRPNDLTVPNVSLRGSSESDNMKLRKQAAKQLEALFSVATRKGHALILASGFRSYQTQASTYNYYVQELGRVEANKISAEPGTSEHQTGWAADVATTDWKCYLETCFGQTPAGRWVAKNAHRFGFIVRYPQNKSSITGYSYEPWHLRYVGQDLASTLYESGQTMEENFELSN